MPRIPADDQAQASLEMLMKMHSRLFQAGADVYSRGMKELVKTIKTNSLLFNRMVEHGFGPTMESLWEINSDVTRPFLETLTGQKAPMEAMEEVGQRVRSGGKYNRLITTMGAQLFGSARFEGETVLAQNEFLTLSHLPAPAEIPPRGTLFHVGGFLPYSDRIFRILPEANLFLPFLEAGIEVYAMELSGDRQQLPDQGRITMERVIESIDEMTEVAFEHNEGQKMVLEGYCGLGMPALAYIAALPAQARRKLNKAFTMVAPVDGRRCKLVGELSANMPDHLMWTQFTLTELHGRYVPGDVLRAGMDIPIGAFFPKTPFGRFISGWKSKEFADIDTVEQLSKTQRKELAGAYWISPENCRRFPMPADLVEFSSRLWTDGVKDDLEIPYVFKGQQLSFRTIVEQTEIELFGFYGGKDLVIPGETAQVLEANLGQQRYTRVVHPAAGHISYILSPGCWKADHPYALDPNPIDLVFGQTG